MFKLHVIVLTIFSIGLGRGSSVAEVGCLGTKCYLLVYGDEFITFGHLCQMVKGAKVGSIPDQQTDAFVFRKILEIGIEPYIGAVSSVFPWKWISSEPLRISIKREGTQSECDARTCGMLHLNSGQLDMEAAACDVSKRYICKRTGASTTSDNIFVSQSSGTWFHARQACIQRGMDLLVFADSHLDSVLDILQQKAEVSRTNTSEFWIGVYSRTWNWTNSGEELLYNNIRIVRTACHRFVQIQRSGFWQDKDFSYAKAALCEVDKSKKEKESPTLTSSEPDIISRVIIPVCCAVGGCIITMLIFIVWTKMKKGKVEAQNDNKRNGESGYEPYEPTRSSRDSHYYEEVLE